MKSPAIPNEYLYYIYIYLFIIYTTYIYIYLYAPKNLALEIYMHMLPYQKLLFEKKYRPFPHQLKIDPPETNSSPNKNGPKPKREVHPFQPSIFRGSYFCCCPSSHIHGCQWNMTLSQRTLILEIHPFPTTP